jgi:RNA polymerase sigma factor (TIGR02999 family)
VLQAEATRLLRDARDGDGPAADRLVPAVYEELRDLAERLLAGERPGHTLQPTALVHEAYLRLIDQEQTDWRDRAHFLAIAARILRRILVDHARGRGRAKRGGGRDRVDLDSQVLAERGAGGVDVEAIDAAMTKLAEAHADAAQVVELRFFGGLSNDECAEVLAVSSRTVERKWQFARAWLFRSLEASVAP